MSEKPKIDPAETYVLDDDELAALDDAGLTGIMKGLTEYLTGQEDEDGDVSG